jgi:hypothetical protein
MSDFDRGSGRTTRQMQQAPHGAVFIWCVARSVNYARDLARSLKREDLRIMTPAALDPPGHRLMGIRVTIVLDHACSLTDRQLETYRGLVEVLQAMGIMK